LTVDVSSWCSDKAHPYYANYLSHLRILDLASKHNIPCVVRLTDLSVGLPAFNLISIFGNIFQSMMFRYHAMTEMMMRKWCLEKEDREVIILRAGDLVNQERDQDTTNLQISHSGKLPYPSYVSKSDVASLALASLRRVEVEKQQKSWQPNNTKKGVKSSKQNMRKGASNRNVSFKNKFTTLAVRWVGENTYPQAQGFMADGHESAHKCIDKMKHDNSIEKSSKKIEEALMSLPSINGISVDTVGKEGNDENYQRNKKHFQRMNDKEFRKIIKPFARYAGVTVYSFLFIVAWFLLLAYRKVSDYFALGLAVSGA